MDLVGWEAQVDFVEGVKNMLSYINDWSDAPVWDNSSVDEATKDWFEYLGKTHE